MRKVSSKFASRRFFGKNILENRREYLVTGQKTVGSSIKSKRSVWEVRDPSSDRDDAVVYKEKVYGYKIPRHKTGGKHWHDITLRRFGKVGKDGDLAQNPGFRRSFMRLKGNSDAKFFFKLRQDLQGNRQGNIVQGLCKGDRCDVCHAYSKLDIRKDTI